MMLKKRTDYTLIQDESLIFEQGERKGYSLPNGMKAVVSAPW